MTVATAHSSRASSPEAAAELVAALGGASPRLIVFFAGIKHDGRLIAEELSKRFPSAHVVGSSTNGEFSNLGYGKNGVVAIALGEEKVGALASVLVPLDVGTEKAVRDAVVTLGADLGTTLRELDGQRFVGLTMLEGAHGRDERINELLGNAAPMLSFVGGAAGDDIQFKATWVARAIGGHAQSLVDGCALVVMEMKVPFSILKSCNAESTGKEVKITKADASKRLVHELDGKPAAERYAELIGTTADKLGFTQFLEHPFGLMLDGDPWLRSLVRTEGQGSLFLACGLVEGMTVHLMKTTDLVASTRSSLEQARAKVGGKIDGAILWNCAYRMLEAQTKGVEEQYHATLSQLPHVGLHSNGECWMAHLNQTLTGLVIG